MKVLFIYPNPDISYPFPIGTLSAFLKKHGHQTALVNLIIAKHLEKEDFEKIAKKIESFSPRLIAFSSYEPSFEWIREIAHQIKKRYQIPIIVGGYYPTLAPQEVIKESSIDIICVGEGEYALLELATSLEEKKDITGIKNLWVKKNDTIYKNPVRPLIENLDELPFPDREIMGDFQKHLNVGRRGDRDLTMLVGRGCPFNCSYCSNHAFKNLYPNRNKYLRIRSVDNVLKEIEEISRKYHFESISFDDDNLTLFPQWLAEFSEKYSQRFRYPFGCCARVETCTEDNLRLLKKAGCRMLLIGLEAGDEGFRKEVLNRPITNSQIVSAFRKARKLGIKTWSFNMVGLPHEGWRQRWKTIWLNLRVAPDFAMTTIYYPFRGTKLGDLCYERGMVDIKRKKKAGTYTWISILNFPPFVRIQIYISKYLNALTALRRGRFLLRETPAILRRMLRHFLGIPLDKES